MARLEGSYEQLGKRLGDLAADLQALRVEFRTEIRGGWGRFSRRSSWSVGYPSRSSCGRG